MKTIQTQHDVKRELSQSIQTLTTAIGATTSLHEAMQTYETLKQFTVVMTRLVDQAARKCDELLELQ